MEYWILGQKVQMNQMGPNSIHQKSEFVRLPHPPGPIWCDKNHWDATHFDPMEQRRDNPEGQKGVDQVELTPLRHQSIHCEGPVSF